MTNDNTVRQNTVRTLIAIRSNGKHLGYRELTPEEVDLRSEWFRNYGSAETVDLAEPSWFARLAAKIRGLFGA